MPACRRLLCHGVAFPRAEGGHLGIGVESPPFRCHTVVSQELIAIVVIDARDHRRMNMLFQCAMLLNQLSETGPCSFVKFRPGFAQNSGQLRSKSPSAGRLLADFGRNLAEGRRAWRTDVGRMSYRTGQHWTEIGQTWTDFDQTWGRLSSCSEFDHNLATFVDGDLDRKEFCTTSCTLR